MGARSRLARSFSETHAAPSGVFGVPGLDRPERFEEMARETKEKCQRIIERILSDESSHKTLDLMDEVSDEACQVMDLAECCRALHPSPHWIHAAQEAHMYLLEYLETLNTSLPTYDALTKIDDGPLNSEEKEMKRSLRVDMEMNGIHLTHDQRNKVIDLQARINMLCNRYQSHIFSGKTLTVPNAMTLNAPSFSHLIERDRFRGTVTIPADNEVINEILLWTADTSVRKQVFELSEESAIENREVLKDLISYRHEYATLVGFPSFAHKSTSVMMSKTPDNVIAQLDCIAEELRPIAEKEVEKMSAGKTKDGYEKTVYPWDTQYYMGKIKATSCMIDSSTLSTYFSLKNCLEGMKIIVKQLFGCELRVVPLHRGERWVTEKDLLQKLEIYDMKTKEQLGVIHLDLFQRGNKGGAACFVTQCSKVNSDGALRMPKVIMSCSFSQRRVQGSSGTEMLLLRHHEFETLLHEFGHALHLVFSRTKYQNLSGFRGPLDFVETPSHFLEHFAWDYRFLRLFARHYRTSEAIPEHMVKRLRASKTMFRAFDILSSVSRAKVDQLLFGPNRFGDATEIDQVVHSVTDELLPIQIPNSPKWHLKFEHFCHYAGGYYSYLYGQMFAAQIWASAFEENPLAKDQGQRYRDVVLAPGASRDPTDILEEFLGRKIDIGDFAKNFARTADKALA